MSTPELAEIARAVLIAAARPDLAEMVCLCFDADGWPYLKVVHRFDSPEYVLMEQAEIAVINAYTEAA